MAQGTFCTSSDVLSPQKDNISIFFIIERDVEWRKKVHKIWNDTSFSYHFIPEIFLCFQQKMLLSYFIEVTI